MGSLTKSPTVREYRLAHFVTYGYPLQADVGVTFHD